MITKAQASAAAARLRRVWDGGFWRLVYDKVNLDDLRLVLDFAMQEEEES